MPLTPWTKKLYVISRDKRIDMDGNSYLTLTELDDDTTTFAFFDCRINRDPELIYRIYERRDHRG